MCKYKDEKIRISFMLYIIEFEIKTQLKFVVNVYNRVPCSNESINKLKVNINFKIKIINKKNIQKEFNL
jgi:hypothetical protein